MELTGIEKRLEKDGWVMDGNAPLILGGCLLNLLDTERTDEEGKRHRYQSVQLYHKGDRYILSWSRWDQSVIPGRITLEERKGDFSDGATHFEAGVEAVAAGFSHVLTVNPKENLIIVWKRSQK